MIWHCLPSEGAQVPSFTSADSTQESVYLNGAINFHVKTHERAHAHGLARGVHRVEGHFIPIHINILIIAKHRTLTD